jgi:dipeptidyl aminopeptidase/acylaminoacyl peptidase
VRYLARVDVALALLGGVLWLVFTTLLRANESRLVFNAAVARVFPAPIDPALFHVVYFTTADGLTLEGVVRRADPPVRYWVLFCPPSGASIHAPGLQRPLQQLVQFGYSVLAFDYRGFGRNPGVPTENGLYEDARAALALL